MPHKLSTAQWSPLRGGEQSLLRLQTITRLRWFAVAGQTLAVVICHFIMGFELPLGPCLLLIAISAWLNVYMRMQHTGRHRLSEVSATVLLLYDLLQLAGLLFLTGGVENPFVVLFVAPVTVSAATLPFSSTLLLGGISIAGIAFLSIFHYPLPWAGAPLPVFPDIYRMGIIASVVACMVFLAIYVRRLANESRQMSDALTATELVLAREQKLHALDGLAAAAAHELGTPLATIVLVSKELSNNLAVSDAKPDGLIEDLELLRTQAQRCRDILQKLTKAPSERDPMHASMTIRQIVDEASEPHRNGRVHVSMEPTDFESSDRAQPEQEPVVERHPGIIYGVGNLIENAVDYARSTVSIRAAWSTSDVVVTIVDDGPGFAPDVLDRIGEPYVTTRSKMMKGGERSGLGLGFFIAKTLLERSGAALTFNNRTAPETGAIVTISWDREVLEALATD